MFRNWIKTQKWLLLLADKMNYIMIHLQWCYVRLYF